MNKKYFGVMLDCSRNAVMKVESVKKFVDYISKMGYNMLQLYTEDTYKMDNEPRFGYMRGAYTKDEIREIDKYCISKGIELMPCVQTLAHLNQIFRWPEYGRFCDIEDILLCDDERTYNFIDTIFKNLADCYTSRNIHVGMDEAYCLGGGRYLIEKGYRPKFDMLMDHIKKVIEIAKKYGFKPMMWSDMLIKFSTGTQEYYHKKVVIKEDKKQLVPRDIGLVFWDYHDTKKSMYKGMFEGHQQFDNEFWFAGSIYTCAGFAPYNAVSSRAMKSAMQACREKNVDKVMITLWGDNGGECSYFSVLSSLFYIKRVYDGVTDKKQIKKEFQELTGESFDAFSVLDLPNQICGIRDKFTNVSKFALYNDLFNGYLDTKLKDGAEAEYKRFAKRLFKAGKTSKFKYVFDCEANFCKVLELKYKLGMKIRDAYAKRDMEKLKEYANVIKKTETRLDKFYLSFKNCWYKENKENGFDVQDIRFGGLKQRLISCRERIEDYINGNINKITELEEPLVYMESDKNPAIVNNWQENVSCNRL